MKTKLYSVFLIVFLFGLNNLNAAPTQIPKGSFLINMGVVPQTYANGLKPYGMVYDLVKNYKVPVYWVINPTKTKDGADFTHNGVNYSGGTFIVPAQYRTTAVNNRIIYWQSQGIVGSSSASAFIAEVYITIDLMPKWTLDKDNGTLALTYFNNASIPDSAYGGSSSKNWKYPSELNSCDELFVMPHATPTWLTHNNLYYWNKNFKGNIWAGCRAGSNLENLYSADSSVQMNFLTTKGLMDFGSHKDGTPPYITTMPTNPVMQYMGINDDASQGGSEQIYIPKAGSYWLTTTNTVVYDWTQENVLNPSLSPNNVASSTVFGPAFGNAKNGWIMYQGGHSIDNGDMNRIAAQRAFFNYCFYIKNKPENSFDITITGLPAVLQVGSPYQIDVSIPSTVNTTGYTYKWVSSLPSGYGRFQPYDYRRNVMFRIYSLPAGKTLQNAV
jgi:hypothetical protein